MARHQRAIAVHQRDLGAFVEARVAVELLEVLDAAARRDDAGKLAGRRLEPAHHRKHPHAFLDDRLGRIEDAQAVAGIGAQVLEHGVVRQVGRRNGQAHLVRDRQRVAGGVEQRDAFNLHQADRLILQVGVQRVAVLAEHGAASHFIDDVAEHAVDGLQAARRLLGDDARLGVEFAPGFANRRGVAANDVEHRHRHDHGDETAADPGNPAPRPGLRGSGRIHRRAIHVGNTQIGRKRRTALIRASREAGLGSTPATPSARATAPQQSTPAKRVEDKTRIGVIGCRSVKRAIKSTPP